ncbi:hypothetical protein DQ04_00121270 [Trypanosoma grayi]|uniref:hypothetical protein n=1 Tax=Trypanosoma grayi TaxID=71804 RepID=UPI0004F4A582|nr:hypothetical protein DQ04_00121270 [Trypanosoma grayi]KEG15295.1 hypothetical protein DQ04_00121270 [Trypanosoma grayi]
MGALFSFNATHEEVPDEVKERVEPIEYTPAPESARPKDGRVCEGCGEPFFYYLTPSTNCNWCGRQLCTRCCPNRHLLGGMPGCPDCTRKAFLTKREQLLDAHLAVMKTGERPAEVDVA